MRKKLFSSLINHQRIQRLQFSSKTTEKVLGYRTKPNENEITADYIGKLLINQNLSNTRNNR